ncbi:MAG: hypothetical protein RLN76_04375 [Phycisphaeraceae bacterium]
MPARSPLVTMSACALALALSASAAAAQTAYFSIEGEITAALGQHDMFFDLIRPVSTSEELRFETWGSAGGVNAAGNVIPSSGVDSVLELFDSQNGALYTNDDGAVGLLRSLDSLLSWPGIAENGGTLPATGMPAAVGNRLKFRDFDDSATGTWAVDLVGPANALQLRTIFADAANPGGVSQLDSVSFGTITPGTPATWNWFSDTTLEVEDTIVVAPTGNAVLNIPIGRINTGPGGTNIEPGGVVNVAGGNLDGGQVTVKGQLNLSAGTIEADSIFLQDNGQLTIDAGTIALTQPAGIQLTGNSQLITNTPYIIDSSQSITALGNSNATFNADLTIRGNLEVEAPATLTLANGSSILMQGGLFRHENQFNYTNQAITLDSTAARLEMPGGLRLNDDASLNVDAGTVDLEGSLLQVGIFGSSNINVSGPGSSIIDARLRIGFGGSIGTVTFDNASTANVLSDVEINFFPSDGNESRLEVLNNAYLQTDNIFLSSGDANSQGTILVENNATIVQTPASQLIIGSATGAATATLTLSQSSTLITGTALTQVNPGGSVSVINNASLQVQGDILFNGGSMIAEEVDAFTLEPNRSLTMTNDAEVSITAPFEIENNNTFNVTTGSELLFASRVHIGDGSDGTLNVSGSNSFVATDQLTNDISYWGFNRGVANITISDSASANFGGDEIWIADSFFPESQASLTIQSGATVSMPSLRLATDAGTGTITVTGTGSRLTQATNAQLIAGGGTDGSATITIADLATLDTGTGITVIGQNGTINMAGQATLNANGSLSINPGGRITGNGFINAAAGLTNNGTLDPQSLSTYNGLQELTLFGNYTQTSSGVIRFDTIDGDATLLDAIGMNGVASLAGELAFVSNDPLLDFGLLPLYSLDPLGGLFFNTENAYTGIFRITGNLLGDGTGLAVIYNEDSIDIFRGLVGDTDGSQVIDLVDLSTLASNFGSRTATWNMGDFNGDNTIDLIDLSLLASNFGEFAPSIPEPASAALVLLLAACLRRPDQQ